MYRCYGCDTPSQLGHQDKCVIVAPEETPPVQEERMTDRINIASGEDVQLEPVCT